MVSNTGGAGKRVTVTGTSATDMRMEAMMNSTVLCTEPKATNSGPTA